MTFFLFFQKRFFEKKKEPPQGKSYVEAHQEKSIAAKIRVIIARSRQNLSKQEQ